MEYLSPTYKLHIRLRPSLWLCKLSTLHTYLVGS